MFDDPTHGQQQLTLFHGYYKQYQYLVRAITCAENDWVALPSLLYGTADVALGLERDLRSLVDALRQRFPDVLIRLRADSGYAKPWLYRLCEQLGVEYSIGLGMNKVLQRRSRELLEQVVQLYEQTGTPQRHFTGFFYAASSWDIPRWVVVKCEVNAQGTNRRAVVTNRPGAQTLPEGVYDEYSERGESENRNKELKCELCADRLSDHRYMANCFRMFLHCLAHNMLVSLRRIVAKSPSADTASANAVVPEAQTGRQRRRQFNQRRKADPLGEGHAGTWRTRLIKVACRIRVTARRVRVFLSGSWPFLDHFRDVSRVILDGAIIAHFVSSGYFTLFSSGFIHRHHRPLGWG